ncbi:hypothetical protein G6F56_008642 [Rhizopus delemar]|nr:hypothetical protein G6F56_008642 [Rhizopus delemar]
MSYALYSDDKVYFYLHVTMMVLSLWILMPLGIMFGIAKSSLHVPTQLLAFGVAMLGFLFAKLYGHSTPHLYKGNSHHTLGWIIFLLIVVQMVVGVVRKMAKMVRNRNIYDLLEENVYLMSSSSCVDATSSINITASGENEESLNNFEQDKNHEQDEYTKESLTTCLFNIVSPFIPNFLKKDFATLADNPFTSIFCRYYHMIMGRAFILLVFTQTLSGLVVYYGVCRSWSVLGCVAHLIKGGIFFFYGLITFARYLGAFSEQGWAWNETANGSSFSFEMIECTLIFVYGITNTWMEHFGQSSSWDHKDLEHASLAFMWLWCGLIGILVESRAVRRLLEGSRDASSSLNPFPALTVFMTGVSMGNHHQETAYSSQIHWLWGILLSSAAACRLLTYVTLYCRRHSSQVSRPPTELVGAFLLIAGSLLFMASNSGTMDWLRLNQIDAMFLMNVVVALTSISLTYVAGLMIVKSWSKKREEAKRQ